MSVGIIDLPDWFDTASGQCLLAWEQARFDEAVADVFGYHAVQLGLPTVQALSANRMPHRWLIDGDNGAEAQANAALSLRADFAALPFSEASLDLVTMPHTLDLHDNPHATLREVARALVPEGRVVITGFNPTSLWGLRFRRERLSRRWGLGRQLLPPVSPAIGYWRLRDWLHLLNFDIEVGRFGVYGPVMGTEAWQRRFTWMDTLGARWWPIFGAAYCVVAVKRVQGVRLLEPRWKNSRPLAAPAVPLANRHTDSPT